MFKHEPVSNLANSWVSLFLYSFFKKLAFFIGNFTQLPYSIYCIFLIKLEKMAKVAGAVLVDTERCKGCGVCVESCPYNVLSLGKEVNAKGYNYVHPLLQDDCIGCTNCAVVCPDSCLTVYRKKIK